MAGLPKQVSTIRASLQKVINQLEAKLHINKKFSQLGVFIADLLRDITVLNSVLNSVVFSVYVCVPSGSPSSCSITVKKDKLDKILELELEASLQEFVVGLGI